MSTKQSNTLSRSMSVIGKLFAGSRKGPSGQRVRQLRKLQKMIGVRFTDLSLLEQALTHRSYSHVTSQTRNESNERMEFLGDSVLGLAVAQFLYLRFPERTEGALSKMKSLLVSRKVLSAVSRDAGFGEFLLLSGEESETGGRDRTSILADSFEGVIGAIYLDQGYRAANKFIQRFLLGNIAEILKDEEHTNYKSLLQEYVQSKRLSHPIYRVRREVGPEHEKEFAIEVVVRGDVWGRGRGRSKKDAEQNAARDALESRRDQAPEPARGPRGRGPRVEVPAGARASGGDRPMPPRRDEPKPVVARHRGEHGVAASRERLRAQRQAEATESEQKEQVRREPRRRDPRPVPGGAPTVAEGRTAAPGAQGPARRPRSRRGRRGGGRGPAAPGGSPGQPRVDTRELATPVVESGNGPGPSEVAMHEPVAAPELRPTQPPVPVVEPVEPVDRAEAEPTQSHAPEEPSPGAPSGGFVRRKRRVVRGAPKK
jgi:ribonuclease-3